MCEKSDIPQLRNTFHHYLCNSRMLDSDYEVSTANPLALLWKSSYTHHVNAGRLIAAQH